jgi:hypothetical protein
MHERKALRDLVMDEAAARGIAREKLWEWACLGVARDELRVELPGRASLETQLGGATTWRDLMAQAAVAAARGNDPARYQWTRHIMLDPVEFGRWLDLRARGITVQPKRAVGAKPTLREAVASFVTKKYPKGLPASMTLKEIARNFEKKSGRTVSERTVRRACGRK